MDKDIVDSQAHEAATSKKLKTTWNWSPLPTAEEKADKALIHGYSQVGADMNMGSDPICPSSGCKKYKRVDPVYNMYPLDEDIADTQANISAAELKHGKWDGPKEEQELQLDEMRKHQARESKYNERL
jgi:hypothetical protein